MKLRNCIVLLAAMSGLFSTVFADDYFQFDGNTGMQFYKDGANLSGMKGSSDFANFTYEAWIYPDNLDHDMHIIDGESSWDISNFVLKSDGSLLFKSDFLPYGDFSKHTQTVQSVAGVVSTGEWSHVAVSFSKDSSPRRLNFCVNGVAVATVDDSDVDSSRTTMWDRQVSYIGQNHGGGNKFEGKMRDVRLWGVAKNEAEILASKDSVLVGDEAGLVAWLQMNQKVGEDVVTLGSNTGLKTKVVGAAMWGGDSVVSNCAYINDGEYVTVADSDPSTFNFNYNDQSKAMAISTWIQTKATSGTIFSRITTPGSDQAGYSAMLRGDGLVDLVFDGWSGSDDIVTAVPINDGKWHHFAVVLNGQKISVYVDGIIDIEHVDQDYDDGVSNSKPLTIGANEDGSNPLVGALADFRIYQDNGAGNSLIAKEDVQAIMADSSNSVSVSNVDLVLQLQFIDNLNNSVANDISTGTGSVEYLDHFTYPEAAPLNLAVSNISAAGFDISWDPVAGATSYQLDIGLTSDYSIKLNGYAAFELAGTSISIASEVMGNLYVRVRAITASGYSAYNVANFTKSDGGAYSLPSGWNYNSRWRISKVVTSEAAVNLVNNPNTENDSYLDFSDNFSFKAHDSSTFALTVGVPDNWCGGKIWIDWNDDGLFDDASAEYVGEIGVLDGVNGTGSEVTVPIVVPDQASLPPLPLTTRMRIMVSDIGQLNAVNFVPMGTNASFISNGGQVQDYSITVVRGRYYVDGEMSDDSGDGASWGSAKNLLASAIALAAPDNAKVFVKSTSDNYSVTSNISIPANVKVYGGFAGTEASDDERVTLTKSYPWQFANPTVLDGTGFSSNRMVTMGSNAVFDGFTVQNGGDGGIQIDGSGAEISNCVIQNISRVAANNRGCAVSIGQGYGKSVIRNSLIHNNEFSGTSGSYPNHSGVAVGSGVNDGSPFDVVGCAITNNRSEISPVFWCRTDNVNVYNSLIAYNEKTNASDTRGIISDNHSGGWKTRFYNCTIVKNVNKNKTDLKLCQDATASNTVFWSNGSHPLGTVSLDNNNATEEPATGTNIQLSADNMTGTNPPQFKAIAVAEAGYQENYVDSDFSVLEGSALIDKGDNDSISDYSFDLYGNDRTIPIVEGGESLVDIGAYEFDFSSSPAIGLEFVQDGKQLTWNVAEELGVKEYRIVNVETGVVVDIVQAGKAPYSYELDQNIAVKLVTVDFNGFTQSYLPADGSKIRVVYELAEGWNLIAMPGANADVTDLETVVSGGIWGWNGTAYEIVSVPIVGKAVWVFAPNNVEAIVEADMVEAELELQPGWNMVGPTVNMEIPPAAYAVYAWDESYWDILHENSVLMQGIGYWIFVVP